MNLENAKPIELEDKSVFTQYFENYPPQISEFTFTNLFGWQHYYNNLHFEYDNHLIIFSKSFLKKWKKPKSNKDEVLFFFPPVGDNPSQIILTLFDELTNVEVHRVPEDIISDLRQKSNFEKSNIKIEEDRDNWDYVYEKDKLIELAGNKYRSKRRLLQSFMEQYDYEFHLISEEWLENFRALQNKWCIINECQSNEDLQEEDIAIGRIFDNYENLDYNGGLILIDEETAGYTIGEMLNTNTNVIHIEKAHTYYEGSYQAINNLFLKECCGEAAKFVNREQDLGIPGLRKAKESYHPHHMVKKSIIYRTKD